MKILCTFKQKTVLATLYHSHSACGILGSELGEVQSLNIGANSYKGNISIAVHYFYSVHRTQYMFEDSDTYFSLS